MKFEKIQPGMVLFDARKVRAGNTTLMTMGVWKVRVISVDSATRTALCSWNGNPARKYYESDLKKLRETEPVLVKSGWTSRLQTRAERKAAAIAKATGSTP